MHYAAAVSSSFFLACSSVGQCSTAAKVSTRSLAASIHYDVLPARCRCRKGKCREAPTSCCDTKSNLSLQRRTPGTEFTSLPRSSLRKVSRRLLDTQLQTAVFRVSPCFTMFSRSIASSASVPVRQEYSYSPSTDVHRPDLDNFRNKLRNSDCLSDLSVLWNSFESIVDSDLLRQIETSELLRLSWLLVENKIFLSSQDLSYRVLWGERLGRLYVLLKKRNLRCSSSGKIKLFCILIASLSLRGLPEKAESLCSRFFKKSPDTTVSEWYLLALKHIIMSFFRHDTRQRAIEFYSKFKDSYTVNNAPRCSRNDVLSEYNGGAFFHELRTIFQTLEDPASFLGGMSAYWEEEELSRIGCTLISVLCQIRLIDEALSVLEELLRRNLKVEYGLRHFLIRVLAQQEEFGTAKELYPAFAPKDGASNAERRSYYATGLYMYSHMGDQRNAEELFRWLDTHDEITPQDITLVLYASAIKGDTGRAVQLFEKLFDEKRISTIEPSSYHFGTMLTAFVVANDIDGMNEWVQRSTETKNGMDLVTYNTCLNMLVRQNNISGVRAILDHMRSQVIKPDVISYTTIISALARRRDLIGAELVFKQMVDEGIAPDRMALTALMNAHVETGSWQGVIRIFDYLRFLPMKQLSITIEVFNTLMKAYVQIGAPLDVVIKHFRKLKTMNMKPNNRTFSLLIQSACDSGRMDIARNLLVRMDELSGDRSSNVQITREALSIVMAAYLRMGDETQARIIHQYMLEQGFQPSAHGIASIVNSYATSSDNGTKDAEEYVNALLDGSPEEQRTWAEHASGRGNALSFLYVPLIKEHVRNKDVGEVEKIYNQYVERGEKPTIEILSLLLDVYRHVENIEGVLRVWPLIIEQAMTRTDEIDDLLTSKDVNDKFIRDRRRSSLICVPLSSYIDALSQAGMHLEIAHTWNKLRASGFQFDAHNWNHLVVALVRAGQVLRAFEIVEKVILPYQRQAIQAVKLRRKGMSSPLLFMDPDNRKDIEEKPTLKHSHSETTRINLTKYNTRNYSLEHQAQEDESDFAFDLQLIQEMSPEWNIWRPFYVTQRALANALDELEAGRLVKPIEPRISLNDSYKEPVYSPEENESEKAAELLQKIIDGYPQAVQKLAQWAALDEQNRVRGRGSRSSGRPRNEISGPRDMQGFGFSRRTNVDDSAVEENTRLLTTGQVA